MKAPTLFAMTVFVGIMNAQGGEVQITQGEDALDVKIDGKKFVTFEYSNTLPKPYFSPVYTTDGTVFTRPLENVEDHPHHRGIWLAIDEVDGVAFWAEKGKIQNKETKIVTASGEHAEFQVENHWVGPDSKSVLIEKTKIRIQANRLISYDIQFEPAGDQVTFGDTKEGLFGIRVTDSVREKVGGVVINSDGKKGTAECWGKPAAWVDYVGPVDGKIHGVALFDHPKNFRPSRYHVRYYGLFTMSPFGNKAYTNGAEEEQPLTIKKGDSLRLRYGIYLHAGDHVEGKVAETFRQYTEQD